MNRRTLVVGTPYIGYFEGRGFIKLYYYGSQMSCYGVQEFYFASQKSPINRALADKRMQLFLKKNRNQLRLTILRSSDLVTLRPLRSNESVRQLDRRFFRYKRLAGFTEWMWNYRKPFHGTLESWKGSTFYKRLILQKKCLWIRYALFCVTTVLLMMAKLVIVPTWFILNLLVLPFLSFYRYVGLRLLRERLRTAPLIDLLGPQYKGDARDRLHETDKEIVDTKHEFYRTGMNILTLLLSVIAILVTASNLQKDVVIRQLTQSKQTLDDSVLTLTLEGKLKDIQIDDLKKAIQQASPIPQVPSPPALSK